MSLIGNLLTIGGEAAEDAAVVGYVWHRYGSTTYATVCGTSSNHKSYAVDDNYFDLEDGVFTCKRAGTYSFNLFGRGGWNNGGTQIYMRYRMYVNGTIVKSVTGNSIGNGGFTDTYGVTLSEGDEIYVTTANNSGTNSHDFGMVVLTA